MNEQNTQQIVQLLPEEYQGMAMTAFGIAMGAITLYFTIISPLIQKSAANKALLQSKADNLSLTNALALSQDDLNKMVNDTFSRADKLMINAKITELEVKLPFADDVGKIALQSQIDELRASLV
jgi:hypothetical protein